jgi:hypothetical protein
VVFTNIVVEYGGAAEMAKTEVPSVAGMVFPQEVRVILEKASQGDVSVLPALRRAFDEHPELAAHFGNLVEHARLALLTLIAGPSLIAREAISREAEKLRERLLETAPSELERLLVDNIFISWMELYFNDMDLAQRLLSNAGPSAATQVAQKRLDRAHARFLAAVKALATVQKLLKPSMSTFELLRRSVDESDPLAARTSGLPVFSGN